MMHLKFKYTNWRGEDHEYVIEPEVMGFDFSDCHCFPEEPDRWAWCVSGNVITRDGDPREGMGPTRRRTFALVKMREVEEVDA